MLRFSLGTLLGLIVFSAIGCAALVNPTQLWAQCVFTFTVAAILLAITSGIFGGGGLRSFAGGFAICALAYFLLVNLPATRGVKTTLLSSRLLKLFQDQIPREPLADAPPSDLELQFTGNTLVTAAPMQVFTTLDVGDPYRAEYFDRIGHCLWTLIVGLAGGVCARVFAGLGEAKRKQDKIVESSTSTER